MLRLSAALINQPILSIRTGGPVATTQNPLINPNNLKIEGYYCTDRFDKNKRLILLTQDIRDYIANGLIINDHEVLSEPSELLRLKDIININFELIGKQVSTVSKKNVGKVSDYAIDIDSMYISKIYVSISVIRNLAGGSLIIDRSQIVEITNKRIIINDLEQTVPAQAAAVA